MSTLIVPKEVSIIESVLYCFHHLYFILAKEEEIPKTINCPQKELLKDRVIIFDPEALLSLIDILYCDFFNK